MSLVANLLPDVTRPDVGLVLASGWIVGTHVHRLVVAPWQHRHRLTAIAAADPWERLAATARGLLRTAGRSSTSAGGSPATLCSPPQRAPTHNATDKPKPRATPSTSPPDHGRDALMEKLLLTNR